MKIFLILIYYQKNSISSISVCEWVEINIFDLYIPVDQILLLSNNDEENK